MAAHAQATRLPEVSNELVDKSGPPPMDVEAWLLAQEDKELVRFVTIGSVDDGKSTLIGRLLHDAHGLYQDQLDAVRRASVKGSTRGAGSTSEIDFSLFTDGLLAEREQGITIDVAYRYFSTEKKKFIIADTPGHVQYTRNMATGASTADAAIILVDARLGVLAQTRRHAHIAALLGIPNVIACVNKMDLIGFDRDRFDAIKAELDAIAERLGIRHLFSIPVSALAGDNVVRSASETTTPWWTGGTLLERLESISPSSTEAAAPFRFPVQLVLRPGLEYRGFAGQIASGSIAVGDEIVVLPSGKRSRVVGVDSAGVDIGAASAPMSIALRLADEIDVSRGDMIVLAKDHDRSPPEVGTELETNLVWMSERPLDRGKTYLLKHTTRIVRAGIEVLAGTSAETLEPEPATSLALNDIGRVLVQTRAPLFFDPYTTNRKTGAFVLIDSVTNDTVAAGMILGRPSSKSLATGVGAASSGRSQVGAEERRERLGQAGVAVQVHAFSAELARDLAFAIERELFDRGRVALVVDKRGEAETCARGGLIALVPVLGSTIAIEVGGSPRITYPSNDKRNIDAAARDFAIAIASSS